MRFMHQCYLPLPRHRFTMATAGRVPWICQGSCTQRLHERSSLKFFQMKYCNSPGKLNQHVTLVFSLLTMTQLRYEATDSWKQACKCHTHITTVLVWLRNRSWCCICPRLSPDLLLSSALSLSTGHKTRLNWLSSTLTVIKTISQQLHST